MTVLNKLKPFIPYLIRTKIKGSVYDFWFYQIPRLKYIWKKLTGVYKESTLRITNNKKIGKLNILYVVPCLLIGGAEMMLWQLLRNIDRSKFTIFVISTHGRGELANQVKNLTDGFYDLSSMSTEWGKNREIACLIKKHDIDIVHFSNSEALFFSSFLLKFERPETRIMNWVHCDVLFFERLYHHAYKRLGDLIDHTVVVNQNMKTYLIEQRGVKPEKVTTILNGVDTEKFSAEKYNKLALRHKYNIDATTIVVSFIARLSTEKNPTEFVRIAKYFVEKFPNSKFIIAGDGYLRKKVEAEIQKYNLQENFLMLGFVNNVAEILTLTDIFLSCSLTEGLPLNILEAMAMGVPVIAHSVGGIKEIIKDGNNGFLVNKIDPELYLEKFKQIVENQNLKSQISKNAIQTIKSSYDIRSTAKKMMDVYLRTFSNA